MRRRNGAALVSTARAEVGGPTQVLPETSWVHSSFLSVPGQRGDRPGSTLSKSEDNVCSVSKQMISEDSKSALLLDAFSVYYVLVKLSRYHRLRDLPSPLLAYADRLRVPTSM